MVGLLSSARGSTFIGVLFIPHGYPTTDLKLFPCVEVHWY